MKRIKTIDVELSQPFKAVGGLDGYFNVRALLRWRGLPVETVTIPITNGECGVSDLDSALTRNIIAKVMAVVVRSQMSELDGMSIHDLLHKEPAQRDNIRLPSISVAVCTRDRADDLRACLNAIADLREPPFEVIVVDNAPRTSATREVVEAFQRSPGSRTRFRYILEPKPGLDWARNRAIEEACGEIIAYTDDDVLVDSRWTEVIGRTFAENPDAMALTGLVEPYELESEAQILFEDVGGFGRGYDRKWYHTDGGAGELIGGLHGGAGKFGTGANMAFRRCLFQKIGTFDPALDVGTPTRGGGDLEMYFRVLKTGHTLVYEPAALVRHRHRISYGALYNQIRNNGVGFFSYVTRCIRQYPEERRGFLKLTWWFFWWWNIRRIFWSMFHPGRAPAELYRVELSGSCTGLFQYKRSQAAVSKHGPVDAWKPLATHQSPAENLVKRRDGIAVRTIDLKDGLSDLVNVREYWSVRLYVLWGGTPVGSVDIENKFHPVSAAEVGDHVMNFYFCQILQAQQQASEEDLWLSFVEELRALVGIEKSREVSMKAAPMRISVVVATYDRPDDLRQCLTSLCQQQTRHEVEVVVVDNHPQSGLTPTVVAAFPTMKLVTEKRGGLSFARNAGFRAARGDVLVATDDDVTMPPDWLEKLAEPFAKADVMMVTGGVLPLELETDSQIQFETYGGLGRGFEARRYDRDWFDAYGRRAVPTWEIGATANAAVRASALRDCNIGYLDEALGAGTPTGCGEDTYLFYRILKAGYAICYEPSAYVWHRHRRDSKALWRQIYAYSKGHAAYHIVTLQHEHDCRALTRLLAEVPIYLFRCLVGWARGYRDYPLSLILAQIWGHVVGPFALWKARRRAARLNREYDEPQQLDTPLRPAAVPVEI